MFCVLDYGKRYVVFPLVYGLCTLLKILSFLKGNTMGYVRMIKAGGLQFVSNSIRFVPDLDDIPNFEELTLKEEVGAGVGNNKNTMACEAAKTLDEVVANLGKNFSDNTEYFQVCFLLPAFRASMLLRQS